MNLPYPSNDPRKDNDIKIIFTIIGSTQVPHVCPWTKE